MIEEVRTREETVYIGECPECKKGQESRFMSSVDVRCSECHADYIETLTINDLVDCTVTGIRFNLSGHIIEIIVVDDNGLEYSIATNDYTELLYS